MLDGGWMDVRRWLDGGLLNLLLTIWLIDKLIHSLIHSLTHSYNYLFCRMQLSAELQQDTEIILAKAVR